MMVFCIESWAVTKTKHANSVTALERFLGDSMLHVTGQPKELGVIVKS